MYLTQVRSKSSKTKYFNVESDCGHTFEFRSKKAAIHFIEFHNNYNELQNNCSNSLQPLCSSDKSSNQTRRQRDVTVHSPIDGSESKPAVLCDTEKRDAVTEEASLRCPDRDEEQRRLYEENCIKELVRIDRQIRGFHQEQHRIVLDQHRIVLDQHRIVLDQHRIIEEACGIINGVSSLIRATGGQLSESWEDSQRDKRDFRIEQSTINVEVIKE